MRANAVALLVWLLAGMRMAVAGDLTSADPALRVVAIDDVERASLLGVRVDTEGRLFVGGREALFAYEPQDGGGYGPRHTLLTFPDRTWVHDIEIRGDDLYVLTVSALYHVPGGRTEREGLVARRLLWGVPRGHTHQCFHGMAFGPEGDLYVGVGDPLWYYGDFARPDHWGHWTFFTRRTDASEPATDADWQRTPYTGVGAILRLRPDGSGLRVVAEGLRNDCGLAFDRDWNLFTNDNDHESLPAAYVPGRLLHVTPRAWFGWPRGWSPDKTPDRLDLLNTMTPRLGRFVPVGQAYHDDPLLPTRYRNALLVARWCTRQVSVHPLEPVGSSYRCTEDELVAGAGVARPVGVTVGRGGRVFVTVCHMDHNEDSPVYRSDLVMVTPADDPATHPFSPYAAPTADVRRLFAELADPAWSRRKEAHAELLRRPDLDLRDLLVRFDAASPDAVERNHLLWIVAKRAPDDAAWERLTKVVGDRSPTMRLQAVRAVAERFPNRVVDLVPLLDDPDPRVTQAAVVACFEHRSLLDDASVVDRLVTGPARSDDTHLRQAAVRLLAERLDAVRLRRFVAAADARTRLAAVLAAGFRLTVPSAMTPPGDGLPLAAWANVDASCRLTLADGTVDLRDLGRLGTFTMAEHWKAGPHTADQETLFGLLAERLADEDERVRLQAAHFVSVLADPRSEPAAAAVLAAAEQSRGARMPAPEEFAASGMAGSSLPADRPAFDPERFAGIDWATIAAQGDPQRGRVLFGAAGVGCSKCHAMAADETVAGGPSLAEAGRRFAVGYLAESVLDPGKVVAPLFRATTVVTHDGRSITGLLAGETAERIELVVADGSRIAIPRSDIDERVVQEASPMPAGLVRTPDELRDILAYLLAAPGD